MAAMTKRVNINAPIAIRNVNPPMYGVCKNVIMSTGDILKCLCKRAIIDEILPDGSTVRLNMRNYHLDNGAGLDVSVHNVTIGAPAVVDTVTTVATDNKGPETINVSEDSIEFKEPEVNNEPSMATTVDSDPTNIPGVVNEAEDAGTPVEEDNSNNIAIEESTIIEETVADIDSQVEATADGPTSSDDTTSEESVTITNEELTTTDVEEDKAEKVVEEADLVAKNEITAKEEKFEVAEKKTTTKSTSNTKKKSSTSSSKKKSTSNK